MTPEINESMGDLAEAADAVVNDPTLSPAARAVLGALIRLTMAQSEELDRIGEELDLVHARLSQVAGALTKTASRRPR